MRDAIRQLLIDNVREVGDRVFEPHAMTDQDGLPALIIRESAETAGAEEYQAAVTSLEVWPYTTRERFTDLDKLAEDVKAALNERRFHDGGQPYYLEYRSQSTDALDEMFKGITRTITFDVWNLAWLAGISIDPDPIAALMAWTEEQFPDEAQTHPLLWQPDEAKPGIYWRLVSEREEEVYPSWTMMRATIRGHILTPRAAKRLEWTRKIHLALKRQRRLHLPDGAPLDFIGTGADSSAHPMRTGQITLEATYGVLMEADAKRPVRHIVLTGDMNEEVV